MNLIFITVLSKKSCQNIINSAIENPSSCAIAVRKWNLYTFTLHEMARFSFVCGCLSFREFVSPYSSASREMDKKRKTFCNLLENVYNCFCTGHHQSTYITTRKPYFLNSRAKWYDIQYRLDHAAAMHQCSIGFVLWSIRSWFNRGKVWSDRRVPYFIKSYEDLKLGLIRIILLKSGRILLKFEWLLLKFKLILTLRLIFFFFSKGCAHRSKASLFQDDLVKKSII